MEIQAQEIVDKRTRYLKRNYQINYAQALSKMKDRIVLLITSQTGKVEALIKQSILYISKTIEAVKPEKSYPRMLKNIKNNNPLSSLHIFFVMNNLRLNLLALGSNSIDYFLKHSLPYQEHLKQ